MELFCWLRKRRSICATSETLLEMENDREFCSSLSPDPKGLGTPPLAPVTLTAPFFLATYSAHHHLMNHPEYWRILSPSRAVRWALKRSQLGFLSEGYYTQSLAPGRYLAAVLGILSGPQRFEPVKSKSVCFLGKRSPIKAIVLKVAGSIKILSHPLVVWKFRSGWGSRQAILT